MQKKFFISYALIFFALLLILSLSRPITEKARGRVVALLAPLWEYLVEVKSFFNHPRSSEMKFEDERGRILSAEEQIQRLQLENQLLINELFYLNGLLDHKEYLDNQIAELQQPLSQVDKEEYENYLKRLKMTVSFKKQALPARIIFRSFDLWNHAFWINVGETDNSFYQAKIVAKNSPVLVGDSIVGVVDYVGQSQSRVRLITDSSLNPSVRVARGGEQDGMLNEHLDFLIRAIKRKKITALTDTDQVALGKILATMKANMQPMKKSWYLAKGELRGSRSSSEQSQVLYGTGFNYDFADEEGEGRDLRTGKLIHDPSSLSIPILKLDDLLITTGMDGVFPPGLKVATVTKIELLKEGDYFYELEAKPTAGNLNELSLVFVLPPLRD